MKLGKSYVVRVSGQPCLEHIHFGFCKVKIRKPFHKSEMASKNALFEIHGPAKVRRCAKVGISQTVASDALAPAPQKFGHLRY